MKSLFLLTAFALSAGSAQAALFVKYEEGVLNSKRCENLIPKNDCGYFLNEKHIEIETPVSNELQNDIRRLDGQLVCAGIGSEDGVLYSLKSGSCQ
jgi:hypothetical protein